MKHNDYNAVSFIKLHLDVIPCMSIYTDCLYIILYVSQYLFSGGSKQLEASTAHSQFWSQQNAACGFSHGLIDRQKAERAVLFLEYECMAQ